MAIYLFRLVCWLTRALYRVTHLPVQVNPQIFPCKLRKVAQILVQMLVLSRRPSLQRLRHLEKECQTFQCKKRISEKISETAVSSISETMALSLRQSHWDLIVLVANSAWPLWPTITVKNSLAVFGNYQTSISRMHFCSGKFRLQSLRAVMLMQQSHAGNSHFCSMLRIIVVNRLEFVNRHFYQFLVCRTPEVASIT